MDATRLRHFVATVFRKVGVRADDAVRGAEVLVRTDMRGVRTHGVHYLPEYVRWFADGHVNPRAHLKVISESPTTATLDAGDGLGHFSACRAVRLAIAKAERMGIALVLVHRANHFGAAGHYALMCAEVGLGGLAFSNGQPTMAVPGGGPPTISNSPTAYAFPDPDGHGPVVFDVALSGMSWTAASVAAATGQSVPDGLLADYDGIATTDPSLLVKGRASLLPVGGHKGFGLALLGEILAGVLGGAEFGSSAPLTGPELAGHAFLAVSIERLMPLADFKARLAQLRRDVHAGGGRLPGEGAAAKERRARASGLEFDQPTWVALEEVAETLALSAQLAAARMP